MDKLSWRWRLLALLLLPGSFSYYPYSVFDPEVLCRVIIHGQTDSVKERAKP